MKNYKNLRKRVILFAIIISMVMSFIPANALSLSKTTIQLSSGETIALTKQQLNDIVTITAEEAAEVAKLFVRDSSKADDVCWNDNTTVTSIVTMYDDNSNDVTAYTVNFNTGYVVISAYLDTESLILEWSDKAAPLYEELDVDSNDKIIYLGSYEYYVDKGETTVLGLYDRQIQKTQLTNLLSEMRDIKNIPESAFEQFSNNNSNSRNSSVIINPSYDALINYGDDQYDVVYQLDYWANYMDYYTGTEGIAQGYDNCCSPVGMTNIIAAYRNRYGDTYAYKVPDDNDALFRQIATYGVSQNYFYPEDIKNENGVVTKRAGTYDRYNYLEEMLSTYSISTVEYELTYLDCFETLQYYLAWEDLLLVDLFDHNIYATGDSGHTVICHGTTRLQGRNKGYYLTYMKLADGWYSAPRYITLASALYDDVVRVEFFRGTI